MKHSVAALVATAVATVGIAMAISADRAAPTRAPTDVNAIAQEDPASALWTAARQLTAAPVREDSLRETAAVGGQWVDSASASASVAGREGTVRVARYYGASEDADAAALLAAPEPPVEWIAIGFKPADSAGSWHWIRYRPDGSALPAAPAKPVAVKPMSSAEPVPGPCSSEDPPCIAQAEGAATNC